MRRRRLAVRAVSAALACLSLWLTPRYICDRRANAFYDNAVHEESLLAAETRAWLEAPVDQHRFHTGSPRFDGEWLLIVHTLGSIAVSESSARHESLRPSCLSTLRTAATHILDPKLAAHDTDAWGEFAMDSLRGDAGHLAYLAYANLALSAYRQRADNFAFAEAHDKISESLRRRYAAHPLGLLESYPGETYPADNAVAVASLLIHGRLTGRDARPGLERTIAALSEGARDPASGLQYQRVESRTGAPMDGARASGTGMSAFALGLAAPDLARPLWDALAKQRGSVLGFGGIHEYPDAVAKPGDIDSGPVLFGFGVSASGFALASARRFGDRDAYRALFRSVWFFGLPSRSHGRTRFVSGGAMGNVVLYALLTSGAP